MLPERRTPEVTLNVTPRRIHELALQRWLHEMFVLKQGYPIPVIFAAPMDAYAEFTRLWRGENNPYAYLFSLKDKNGAPYYQPYPAPVRYPLISVKRGSTTYSPTRSFNTRMDRAAYYRTVSKDASQNDIAIAVNRQMPTGWDFTFQITHMCTRPDTKAYFEHQLMRSFFWSGGTAQTFLAIVYPQRHGLSNVRMTLEGSIDDTSPETQTEEQTVYWTSITVKIEGYSVDISEHLMPVMWAQQLNAGTSLPVTDVNAIFRYYKDLREDEDNPVFNIRDNLPNTE